MKKAEVKKEKKKNVLKEYWPLYLMMLPALLYLLINISKLNYGFISDDSIFWKEYNLRKLGLTRFCKEYYGLNINYVDENKAKHLEDNKTNKLIETKDNTIVINLDYLK